MVMTKEEYQHRKDEHISLAVKYWKFGIKAEHSSFDDVRLVPNALPESTVEKNVDLSVDLLGHKFELPFYIEAMTGGSPKGDQLNEALALISANLHIPMALGSQSIALRYPELVPHFSRVRELNPDGFLLANMGAGHSVEDAKQVVDMIAADALEIHVNAAQELAMKESEGDQDFHWLDKINEIAVKLDVPVIVKEVGFGLNQDNFIQLAQTDIAAINAGGAGGTSFGWIEHQRNRKGVATVDINFSTPETLLEAKFAGNKKPLIATGGVRGPHDIVKAQILGADLVSSAGKILCQLVQFGQEETEAMLMKWKSDLEKIQALNITELIFRPELQTFIDQRENKQGTDRPVIKPL